MIILSKSKKFPLLLTNSGWNYLDENGAPLFEEFFSEASPFIYDVAVVKRKNGLYSIALQNGTFLKNLQFPYIEPFRENFAVVLIDHSNYNYIDKNGNFLLKRHARTCVSFQNGFGIVSYQPNLYGYVDANGNFPFGFSFSHCNHFHNDIAEVILDETQFYLSKTGKLFRTLTDIELDNFITHILTP